MSVTDVRGFSRSKTNNEQFTKVEELIDFLLAKRLLKDIGL